MIWSWLFVAVLNLGAGIWNLSYDNKWNHLVGYICVFVGGWFFGKILAYMIFPHVRRRY